MTVIVAPSPEDVRSILARVLASGRFVRSRRASQLLSYLVEATLSGRGENIKAFSIAVDVFGKDQSFDADNDTLVRVQAGRLRDMLETYFEGEGRDAPVLITMPRGGYVLHFQTRHISMAELPLVSGVVPIMAQGRTPAFQMPVEVSAPITTSAPVAMGGTAGFLARWQGKAVAIALVLLAGLGVLFMREPAPKPVVGVRPAVIRLLVAKSAGDAHERAVLQSIRAVASRFSDFDTIARDEGGTPTSSSWPEDYRLRIEKNALGETFAISLSAEHVATGTVVGSVRTSLTTRSSLDDLLPLEQALVKLLQPYGAIYTDYQRRGDYSPVMRCMILREDYIPDQTDERHEKARECAEELIAAGVEDARVYNVLSFMHLEEHTDQRNLRPGDPLRRAINAAQRAIEISPTSGEAHERLMTVYALTGDFEQMVQAGRRAMVLNPANSSAMDTFAARLNYRGQHAEALKLLLRAEQLQPVAPRWRAYAFFLAYYGQGQTREAIARASTLVGSPNPLYLAARVIVARHQGDAAERAEALAMLAREERGFLKEPRAMFERRHYNASLIDRLVEDITATDVAAGPARMSK
jgi:tetratricopeptide (TPR) repeat protein